MSQSGQGGYTEYVPYLPFLCNFYFYFFFMVAPAACRSSLARDPIQALAVTYAIAAVMLDL